MFGEKPGRGDKARGISFGFDHYFVKPLDFDRLRMVLDGIAAQPG
jgi:DNA-binding response OmpR family regulator